MAGLLKTVSQGSCSAGSVLASSPQTNNLSSSIRSAPFSRSLVPVSRLRCASSALVPSVPLSRTCQLRQSSFFAGEGKDRLNLPTDGSACLCKRSEQAQSARKSAGAPCIRSQAAIYPHEEFRGRQQDGLSSIWKKTRRSLRRFSPKGVAGELIKLAIPAVIAGLAEPIAQLTETAFIARTGAVSLAAIGVSISVFNLVSKVFNFPLLNITTSFVAEDGEARAKAASASTTAAEVGGKRVVPAVSAALLVGGILGIVEAIVLATAAAPILGAMGVPAASPMRGPALHYLSLRALGAPAVVLALATQGVFRGFKDTRTPLIAQVGGNVVNIALDPVLMFACGLGVNGAAFATVTAQYGIAAFMLWQLSQRVVLMPPRLSNLKLDRFLKSGGLLLGRTLALLCTMTLATSMAARQGHTSMAAHQIAMQIWLAVSLMSDSVALGAQTMLASAFARHDAKKVKKIAMRATQMALLMGVTMATLLTLATPYIPRVFTADRTVQKALTSLMPFVAATQPITSLAFVFDGLHYGASDFAYAATAMITVMPPIAGVLAYAPRVMGIHGVWVGLTLIMTARMLIGLARVFTASGPWSILKEASGSGSQPPAGQQQQLLLQKAS
ncbi:hypothetical protein CLOM_g1458 [Closterium sp. NIES-68]|nr:hypothetical protein CLOM_g1458 [Closterium sp. NIES-68]